MQINLINIATSEQIKKIDNEKNQSTYPNLEKYCNEVKKFHTNPKALLFYLKNENLSFKNLAIGIFDTLIELIEKVKFYLRSNVSPQLVFEFMWFKLLDMGNISP